jgi:hypothetical protein
MRTRFAATALAAVCLTATSVSQAFEREPIQPGDTVLAELRTPFSFVEFPVDLAQGSYLTFGVTGAPRPILGMFDYTYTTNANGLSTVPLVPVSATAVRTAFGVGSATYRLVVGVDKGWVGPFKLKTSVKPTLRFTKTGTGASASGEPVVGFGAYPGFTATVSVKWKGPEPITLASLTGPDGTELSSPDAPRTTSKSLVQGGFQITSLGDHRATFTIPASVTSYTATVQLAGRLPPPTTHDLRRPPALDRATITFPTPGFQPVASVADEVGGPNEIILATTGPLPNATFLHGGAGTGACGRVQTGTDEYLIFCYSGYSARIENVVRYTDGPWKDLIRSYEASEVRTPQGTGWATLSDFEYDAARRPVAWTEIRRFDATGRAHRLVFSRGQYGIWDSESHVVLQNACAGFRVVHTPPDGVERTYDYGPFR